MCDFITEIKKENGEEYPGQTLYDLVSSLNLYLECENFDSHLLSKTDKTVRNTLDNLMQERKRMGLGKHREKDIVTEDMEELLWQKGILGENDPDTLTRTVFYLIGTRFGIRGGQEHRNLVRYPSSQIIIEKVNGKDCLVYQEFASKTNGGGLGKAIDDKKVYAFCSGFRERCFVEIYKKFQFYCPPATYNHPYFYLKSDPDFKPGNDFWYVKCPIGKNLLGNMVSKMMDIAGIEGYFTNHSLRGTTATRLYQKNVDEQLIKEITGHRSDAVRRYKKTSMAMKENISDLLNVVPPTAKVSKSKDGKGVKNSGKRQIDHDSQVLSTSGESSSKNRKIDEFLVPVPIGNELSKKLKEGENSTEVKPHPMNIHLNVPQGLSNLNGLVNIHFHFK